MALSRLPPPPVRRAPRPAAALSSSGDDAEWNLTVGVRLRPLNEREMRSGYKDVLRAVDSNMVVAIDTSDSDDYLRQNRSKEKKFIFDRVFDRSARQEDVFDGTCSGLVSSLLDGFNATVFAYGATGSGKTHTMLGNPQSPGVMVLMLRQLMSEVHMRKADVLCDVSLSYLEVYNENIKDLLDPRPESLDLREDPIRGVCVAGITQYPATNAEEIMALLMRGNESRTVESTRINEVSSRSHAVLQVVIEQRPRTRDTSDALKVAKLSLIDLAGSERAYLTENKGQRLVEGANINRSLLALANCITALGDKKKRGAFVPYRDSKLTRLLKDSLGGNCRTVMIANISPASVHFDETLNTLKYANRAKNIKNKSHSNVRNVSHHITEYQKIIGELRTEIADLKVQLHTTPRIDAPLSGAGDGALAKPMSASTSTDYLERRELNRIRDELVNNFQERIQLRKSIMEIEDTNAVNLADVQRKERQIKLWEEIDAQKHRRDIESASAEIETIESNMQANANLKQKLLAGVAEVERSSKRLKTQIGDHISKAEFRQLLEMLVHTHVLDLENLQLELQVRIRDKIIEDQQQILVANHLDSSDLYEAYKSSGLDLEYKTRTPATLPTFAQPRTLLPAPPGGALGPLTSKTRATLADAKAGLGLPQSVFRNSLSPDVVAEARPTVSLGALVRSHRDSSNLSLGLPASPAPLATPALRPSPRGLDRPPGGMLGPLSPPVLSFAPSHAAFASAGAGLPPVRAADRGSYESNGSGGAVKSSLAQLNQRLGQAASSAAAAASTSVPGSRKENVPLPPARWQQSKLDGGGGGPTLSEARSQLHLLRRNAQLAALPRSNSTHANLAGGSAQQVANAKALARVRGLARGFLPQRR